MASILPLCSYAYAKIALGELSEGSLCLKISVSVFGAKGKSPSNKFGVNCVNRSPVDDKYKPLRRRLKARKYPDSNASFTSVTAATES